MPSLRLLVTLLTLALIQLKCTIPNSGKKLAERSCGSCHAFPEPSLLDKKTWESHVLPRMGALLGMGDKQLMLRDMGGNSRFGSSSSFGLIPEQPLLSDSEWESIKHFYINNAPDTLKSVSFPKEYKDLASKFDFEIIENESNGSSAENTVIHFDDSLNQFYIGGRSGGFNIYTNELEKLGAANVESSPTAVIPDKKGGFDALLIGEIMPNNQPLGGLVKVSDGGEVYTKIPGLFRPAYMQKADLNQDGKEDYLISSFGYHIGKLAWYENTTLTYKEHLLLPIPGALKTIIEDINGDGLPDILALMSQGDEAIYYFENVGRGKFQPTKWFSLPPVYGSADFQWSDINADGFKDIIMACGDNTDYSLIAKPYHGLRFFINDGKNHFTQEKFIPLEGATGIQLADFDLDGDKDLAVIANFASFSNRPQRGFVLYDNVGDMNFEPFLSSKTDVGRWLVFEKGDFDKDGDEDLLLGSHLVGLMVKPTEMNTWANQHVNLLLLRNKAK